MRAVEQYKAIRIKQGPREGKRLLTRVLKLFVIPNPEIKGYGNDKAAQLKIKLERLCTTKQEIYTKIHFYYYVTDSQVRNILTYIPQIHPVPSWLRPLNDKFFDGLMAYVDQQNYGMVQSNSQNTCSDQLKDIVQHNDFYEQLQQNLRQIRQEFPISSACIPFKHILENILQQQVTLSQPKVQEKEKTEELKQDQQELQQDQQKLQQNEIVLEPPKKKQKVFVLPQSINYDYFWEQQEIMQRELQQYKKQD